MMSRIHARITLGTLLATVALSGCQHMLQKPVPSRPAIDANGQVTAFSLQGKIGVKTPQQSGSAFYTWEQNQQHFNIQLNGILGIGKTVIEGQPGQVTLNSAKTGLISADSAEELLEQATGWVAPITHLVYWVQARPATGLAQTQTDAAQRITQIVEDGWTVDLSYQDTAALPNKLILKQQLDAAQENRITLVIQNR